MPLQRFSEVEPIPECRLLDECDEDDDDEDDDDDESNEEDEYYDTNDHGEAAGDDPNFNEMTQVLPSQTLPERQVRIYAD